MNGHGKHDITWYAIIAISDEAMKIMVLIGVCVLCDYKNCLFETILLRTHNTILDGEMSKLNFNP